jgi:hypothetical protein
MSLSRFLIFYLTLLFTFIINLPIFAQSTNTVTISGKVVESKTEELLTGVTVQLEGTQKGAVTDVNGRFELTNVKPGSYNITASFVGFKSATIFNVIVRSGGNEELVFRLEEDLIQLDDVVVTPNPFTKTSASPLSIQKLSKSEIETYPGGNNDIAKVVQSLPGIASSVGGFRNDVIIRGGGPSENVYYLDGVEIPNINHFATQGSAGGPVGLLNVSFFEGVTVTTSAFSAQYDNVLSGVLQFDQRDGNLNDRRTNIRVSASEAALTTEGALGKKGGNAPGSYILSVRRSYLQFLFDAIGLPFLPDYWDYQYRFNFRLDDRNEFLFTGIGSLDDFSVNPPDEFDAEQEATLDQVPVIKQWTSSVGLTWKHKLADRKGIIESTLSTSVLNNDFSRFSDNRTQENLIFRNESRDAQTTLRVNTSLFYSDWDIKFGGNANWIHFANNALNQNEGFTFNTDLDFIRFGLYGEAARTWANGRLTTSFGIRADGNSFTTNGVNLLNTISPRVAARYLLTADGNWSASAAVGRYFKLPPSTLLGFQGGSNDFINRSVDYIRSDHLTAGIEHLLDRTTRISIEAFYKRYAFYPVSVQEGVSLANLGADFEVFGNEAVQSFGEGRTYGLEFLFQRNLTDNFYGILAYTLFWSEFSDASRNFLPSAWDNRHLLTFTGGYKFKRNWELAIRSRFVGETPFAPVDTQASLPVYPELIVDYTGLRDNRLGTFLSVDVRIDKKWNYKNATLNLFLEVQNALGADLPSPPNFGLNRNDDGAVLMPREIIQIVGVDNSARIPTIGLVFDF